MIFKKIFSLIFIIFLFTNYLYAEDTLSIQDAERLGMIALDIQGKGGRSSKSILMKIKNLSSKKKVTIKLEAGRQLDSVDSTEQNMLVVKSYISTLSEEQEEKIDIYALCCQMRKHSPKLNSRYNLGNIAAQFVALAEFIDKNNYYESEAAQYAVWVLSDGFFMEGVYGKDKNETKAIQHFLHKQTKIPIPWYNIVFEKDSILAFSARPQKLIADFEYKISTKGLVTLGIYSYDGKLVSMVFNRIAHNPGKYVKSFTIDISKMPRGTYYTHLFIGKKLILEKEIVF